MIKQLKQRTVRFSDYDWSALTIACQMLDLRRSRVIRDGAMERLKVLVKNKNNKPLKGGPNALQQEVEESQTSATHAGPEGAGPDRQVRQSEGGLT